MKMTRVNQPTRRALAFGATVLLATGTRAFAQPDSPRAFLEGLYKPYLAKPGEGTPRPDTWKRYFAPPLMAAIDADLAEARKRGGPPRLNGDPFVDAQDWTIANLVIDVRDATSTAATGIVAFTNFGEKQTVTLDLVPTGAGWRIAEIRSRSGSLRALLAEK